MVLHPEDVDRHVIEKPVEILDDEDHQFHGLGAVQCPGCHTVLYFDPNENGEQTFACSVCDDILVVTVEGVPE